MTHQYSPPPNARRADEVLEEMAAQQQAKLERAQARAVSIPEGEISVEMFGKVCRENVGFITNRLIEVAENPDTPPAIVAKIGDMIYDRAYGKADAGPQVQINMQNNIRVEYV